MTSDKRKDGRNEIILSDNEIICSLTNKIKKHTEKEQTLQHMISILTMEYEFDTVNIERSFTVLYDDDERIRYLNRQF